MSILPVLFAALAGGVIGWAIGRRSGSIQTDNSNTDMALNKGTLLQVLGIIAAALAQAQDERVENARLRNDLETYKQDHDLVEDPEVNAAISAVLRAAEQAPPTEDARHAVNVVNDSLARSGEETMDELRTRREADEAEARRTAVSGGSEEKPESDEARTAREKAEAEQRDVALGRELAAVAERERQESARRTAAEGQPPPPDSSGGTPSPTGGAQT